MQDFRLALCQCPSDVATPDEDPRPRNLERLRGWASRAHDSGAQLAAFGELYLTGYRSDADMHRYALLPSDEDKWVGELRSAAREFDLWLLVGAVTAGSGVPGDLYNSALLVSPDGLQGVYRKTHVATFPIDGDVVANEGCYYSPGHSIDVFDTPFCRLGVEICYDIHFPEVARVLALKGAEVTITIAAAMKGFEDFWDVLLPVRAEENRSWHAMASVVGTQKETGFFGGSRIVSPVGQVVQQGPNDLEDLVVADITAEALTASRRMSHRFSSRRPELYEVIAAPTPHP